MIRMTAIPVLLFALSALPRAAIGGSITATAQESSIIHNQIYKYDIINNGLFPIKEFDVGKVSFDGDSELLTPPVGWSFVSGVQPGTYTSPPGWKLTLVTTEGSAGFYLSWSILQGSASLQPGQSLSGFSVTLPSKDAAYKDGHWTAILNDATTASALLQPAAVPEPTSMIPGNRHDNCRRIHRVPPPRCMSIGIEPPGNLP